MKKAALDIAMLDLEYTRICAPYDGYIGRRTIEPHLLIYKQNIWYVYAWCRKRSAFRLFKIGRIRSARATGEKFEKRPFDRENLIVPVWMI